MGLLIWFIEREGSYWVVLDLGFLSTSSQLPFLVVMFEWKSHYCFCLPSFRYGITETYYVDSWSFRNPGNQSFLDILAVVIHPRCFARSLSSTVCLYKIYCTPVDKTSLREMWDQEAESQHMDLQVNQDDVTTQKINEFPFKRNHCKRKFIFQPSISCYMLVFRGV